MTRARRQAPCPVFCKSAWLTSQAQVGRPAALAGHGGRAAWRSRRVRTGMAMPMPVGFCRFTVFRGMAIAHRWSSPKLQGNRGLSCHQGLSRHKQVPPTGCPPFIPRSLAGCVNPCSIRFFTATNSAMRWHLPLQRRKTVNAAKNFNTNGSESCNTMSLDLI